MAEPAQGHGGLVAEAAAGATTVRLDSTAEYHVGGTINVDTGGGGGRLESRTITEIGTPGLDGTGTDAIVTDRSWRAALGPLVTDAWYSGSGYDARREQPGWDRPRSDLSPTAERRDGSAMGWTDAGIAPPPNLATRLVARTAEPIMVQEELTRSP